MRNRPYLPCVGGLLLSGVCGDSEPPADICSYVCSMSGVNVLPPGPPGASVLGGSYCFPTPRVSALGGEWAEIPLRDPGQHLKSMLSSPTVFSLPQPVWETQLCSSHVASWDSYRVSQGADT